MSGKSDSSHTLRIRSEWCPPKLTNNPLLNEDDLESVEDYEEKVIYVRTKKVGYLIGTSGRTIRGFETNSGAKIDILKPNSQYVEQDLYKRVKFRQKDTHSVKGPYHGKAVPTGLSRLDQITACLPGFSDLATALHSRGPESP